MKKCVKTILSLLLGTSLLSGCSGISGLSGSILDEVSEGSGEYDWKKYEVNIPFNTYELAEEFRSNCSDDCIYNLSFFHKEAKRNDGSDKSYTIFEYDQRFSWSDDLQVFFVLNNGYVTEVRTSHTDWGSDEIVIYDTEEAKLGFRFVQTYIKEIWIRTDD